MSQAIAQATTSIVATILSFFFSVLANLLTLAVLVAVVMIIETQFYGYVKLGPLTPYAYLGAVLIGLWNAAPRIQETFRKLLGLIGNTLINQQKPVYRYTTLKTPLIFSNGKSNQRSFQTCPEVEQGLALVESQSRKQKRSAPPARTPSKKTSRWSRPLSTTLPHWSTCSTACAIQT